MNKININIYLGNHGKQEGVEDFLTILRETMIRRGFHVETSANLYHNKINIIIDEFTNFYENRKISLFKKSHPDSRMVFVLTEFVEEKFFIKSTNHFGNLYDSALLSILNIIIRYKREDYSPSKISEYLLALFFSPLALLFVLVNSVVYLWLAVFNRQKVDSFAKYIRYRIRKLAYLHMRYLGLETNLKYADLIVTSHDLIAKQLISIGWLTQNDPRFIGVIYPEFDKEIIFSRIFVGKSPFIEITGTITPYRQTWVNKYNTMVLIYGLRNILGYARTYCFDQISSMGHDERAAFSFHPPQTSSWKYSSPTRLFRALQIDGTIPVITKYFAQHPIEDVCLVFNGIETLIKMIDLYYSHEAMREFLQPKIEHYNRIAIGNNEDLVRRICLQDD